MTKEAMEIVEGWMKCRGDEQGSVGIYAQLSELKYR
jgi:hypothetical protein